MMIHAHEYAMEIGMTGDNEGPYGGNGIKKDRQGLASPDGPKDRVFDEETGDASRIVNSESTLNEWTRQVWLDNSLSQWTRGILTSLSADVDKEGSWTAPLIRAKMIDDDEGYGFSTRTYDKYRKEAIKSGWVEKIGETMIKYGERAQWYPEYRLTLKG